MSGEINRVPRGLTNLLDLSSRGNLPRFLDGNIQAGLDITELYLLDRRETVVDTAVVTSIGNFAFFLSTVPQQELWYVWDVAISPTAQLLGGGLIRYQIGVVTQPNNRFAYKGDVLNYQAQAGDLPIVNYNVPFWLTSGEYMLCAVHEFAAFSPNPTMGLELRITRVRV